MTTKKRFSPTEEFQDCSEVVGTARIDSFLGWDHLFIDSFPDIYQTKSGTIYLIYKRCKLNADLRSIHPSLSDGAKLKKVWIDVLFGDAVIMIPGTKERVRILMRSCDFKVLAPKGSSLKKSEG